eukprot:scaffold168_cov410-Prasinococcus_capsulatus_cf.AAC.4
MPTAPRLREAGAGEGAHGRGAEGRGARRCQHRRRGTCTPGRDDDEGNAKEASPRRRSRASRCGKTCVVGDESTVSTSKELRSQCWFTDLPTLASPGAASSIFFLLFVHTGSRLQEREHELQASSRRRMQQEYTPPRSASRIRGIPKHRGEISEPRRRSWHLRLQRTLVLRRRLSTAFRLGDHWLPLPAKARTVLVLAHGTCRSCHRRLPQTG